MTTEYIDIVIRERGAKKAAAGIEGVGRKAKGAQRHIAGLTRLLASVGFLVAARGVNRLAGEYARLDRRMSQFVTAGRSSTSLLRDMQQQANRTDSSLLGTTEAYARISIATEHMGVSHQRVLGIVDTTQKLIQLSGATAMEATAGIQQFSQALASNRLGGDEFRSLMENTPQLMRALAEGIGVPIGKLKQMGAEGLLTADVVVNALEKMRTKTDKAFAGLERTPMQAMTRLRNNAAMTFGTIAEKAGLIKGATVALDFFAEHVQQASIAVIALGVNMATMSAGGAVAGMSKMFRGIGMAAKFMWRAILGPIGLVIIGIAGIVSLYKKFENATISAGGKTVTLGQIWHGVTKRMGKAWSTFTNFIGKAYKNGVDGLPAIMQTMIKYGKIGINLLVGVHVGGYRAISRLWQNLPGVVGDVAITTANAVIGALEFMVQRSIDGMNTLIFAAESVGKFFTPKKWEKDFGRIGDASFGRLANNMSGTATQVFGDMKKDFVGALGDDYLGKAATGIKKILVDIADTSYQSGARGADGLGQLTDSLTPVKPAALSALEALEALVKGFDKTGKPFDVVSTGLQKLNALRDAGVLTNDKYRTSLSALRDSYIATGGTLEQFNQLSQDNPLETATERLIQQLDRLQEPLSNHISAQEKLRVAYRDGQITGDEYIDMLDRLNVAYADAGGGQGTFASGFLAQLATMRRGAQDLKRDVGTLFGKMFTDFASGAAQAFGRAIVYGDNLRESLSRVAKDALASLVGMLIKMGLQMVINAVLGKTLAAGATAATVAAAGVSASAWAPAAAFASLASFGANAAPAGAAILGITALTKGLAIATSAFAKGGSFSSAGVQMFAKGGVFNSPTAFQFSEGGAPSLGVMGEAGAEAVLPLKRGRDGRLGVTMNHAGANDNGAKLNVNLQNYAPGVVHTVEQIGPNEVRIIARQEASQVVSEEAPKAVADDLQQPNGHVSTALNRYTQTERKR